MRLRILSQRLAIVALSILLFHPALWGNGRGTQTVRSKSKFVEPELGAPQQKLPSVCYGDKQKYGVKGDNGNSIFIWSAYTFLPNGSRVDIAISDIQELNLRGDSVAITWKDKDNANVGGIYTLEVIQKSDCGLSEPYKTDIVVNTVETIKQKEVIPFCDNIDSCKIDFTALPTFKDYTRLYIHPSTEKWTKPELYVKDTVTRKVRFYSPDYSCAFAAVKPDRIPSPKFDLGNDTMLHEEDELPIDVYNPTFSTYEWYTDNTTAEWWAYVSPYLSSIVVKGIDGPQFIRLKITGENGCSATDSIQITVADETALRIPAAFTPNGDGINDTWVMGVNPATRYPSSIPEVIEIRVYDRWGTLVWYKNDGYEPWDGVDKMGRALPVDSYHYEVVYIEDFVQKTARGSVTILR